MRSEKFSGLSVTRSAFGLRGRAPAVQKSRSGRFSASALFLIPFLHPHIIGSNHPRTPHRHWHPLALRTEQPPAKRQIESIAPSRSIPSPFLEPAIECAVFFQFDFDSKFLRGYRDSDLDRMRGARENPCARGPE